MSASSLDTLFLPLQNGQVEWQTKTLFMGAQFHPYIKEAGTNPECWQIFKPFADNLFAHGCLQHDILPNDTYTLILCAIPKQVEEAKSWIAQGAKHLDKGGILMLSASNDAGGSRLEKWLKEAGFEDIYSESKNKARVVWAKKSILNGDIISRWIEEGAVRAEDFGDGLSFHTQPGLFSWDRIDAASRLLVENFPPAMKGQVADFGCGYGYLSYEALKNYDKILSLTMVEADVRALNCALKNVQDVRGDREVESFWHDATKPLPSDKQFDFILMNPPFHTAKSLDIPLGQGFIANAAKHLKKGGSLSLVANNHLPYESILEPLFKNVKLVVQKNGFKIIRAVK